MSEVMQMRSTAASIHELLGAALLRRVTCARVVEVQYEEHTPEPWTEALAQSSGRGGGRAAPPPPPRANAQRRYDATVRVVNPALAPRDVDASTQPIWQPTPEELAQREADPAAAPSYVTELLASEPGYEAAAASLAAHRTAPGSLAAPPSYGHAPGYDATGPGAETAPSYATAESGFAPAPGYGTPTSGFAPAAGYGAPESGFAPAASYGAPASGIAPAAGYAAPEARLAPAQGYGPPAGFIAPPPGYGGSTLPGFTAPADPALSGYGAPFSEQVPGYAAPPAGAPSFGDAQPYAGPAPTYTAPSYAAGVPTFGNTLPATPDAAYAPPAEWFDASQVSEEPSQLTAAEGGLPRLEIPPPRIPDFVLGEALLPERAHDPHYYPGISDEEEPDAFEKPAPNWRRWAIFGGAGLAIFVAGMIARGTSGGSSNQGKAVIDVTPLDAQVTLDGEVLASGTSPRTREGLMHGEHVVQVERRGFLSQRRVFSLGENEGERRIVITLEPEPVVPPAAAAQPAAAAPAEPTPQPAAVAPSPEPEPSDKPLSAKELARQRRAERVAERYRERKAAASADGVDGKTARALARAEAKAAKAEARAAKAAARAEAKAAKASKGEAVASGGATALLKLNSTPWSEVYVDDRHVGHTPLLGLPLSAGSHKIRLVNPTLGGSKTFKIRLKAGQTLTKVVKL